MSELDEMYEVKECNCGMPYCKGFIAVDKEEPQEHKIPEKIEMVGCNMRVNILDKETLLPTENMQTEFLIKKINEIIDYLEEIE